MKLHHLLHEYFMKPQLRSFQLAEPGAGAGPWPLVPRARGDRDTRVAVCPGQRLVPEMSPGCHRSSVLPGLSRAQGQQRPWEPRRAKGRSRVGGMRSAWQPRKMVLTSPTGCSASPRRSSSSPSGPACSLELSFPPAASLGAITNLSPLPAVGDEDIHPLLPLVPAAPHCFPAPSRRSMPIIPPSSLWDRCGPISGVSSPPPAPDIPTVGRAHPSPDPPAHSQELCACTAPGTALYGWHSFWGNEIFTGQWFCEK